MRLRKCHRSLVSFSFHFSLTPASHYIRVRLPLGFLAVHIQLVLISVVTQYLVVFSMKRRTQKFGWAPKFMCPFSKKKNRSTVLYTTVHHHLTAISQHVAGMEIMVSSPVWVAHVQQSELYGLVMTYSILS